MSKVLGHICMNNNAPKVIMDCVSPICRTVEAAMINKMIRQILNSVGPVCVTHQVQLNKEYNCLPAMWRVAMSQCQAQPFFAQGTLALDTQLRACPCLTRSYESAVGWMFGKLSEEPKLCYYDSVFKTSLPYLQRLDHGWCCWVLVPCWVHEVLAALSLQ